MSTILLANMLIWSTILIGSMPPLARPMLQRSLSMLLKTLAVILSRMVRSLMRSLQPQKTLLKRKLNQPLRLQSKVGKMETKLRPIRDQSSKSLKRLLLNNSHPSHKPLKKVNKLLVANKSKHHKRKRKKNRKTKQKRKLKPKQKLKQKLRQRKRRKKRKKRSENLGQRL
jgi:hypothetical protein